MKYYKLAKIRNHNTIILLVYYNSHVIYELPGLGQRTIEFSSHCTFTAGGQDQSIFPADFQNNVFVGATYQHNVLITKYHSGQSWTDTRLFTPLILKRWPCRQPCIYLPCIIANRVVIINSRVPCTALYFTNINTNRSIFITAEIRVFIDTFKILIKCLKMVELS